MALSIHCYEAFLFVIDEDCITCQYFNFILFFRFTVVIDDSFPVLNPNMYLLPFAIVVGICFLLMLAFMVSDKKTGEYRVNATVVAITLTCSSFFSLISQSIFNRFSLNFTSTRAIFDSPAKHHEISI